MDLLCIVGFDGRFKRVNPAFERALGCSQEDLLTRSALDVTHPDDVEPSREALMQLAEGRDVVGFASRVISADGTVRWIEWNTRTMPERGVIYGVGRDATERRRADAELRETQRSLEARRDDLRVLAEEQAALRRVATLVARETPPEALFAAVAQEVGELLGVDATHLGRYDPDGTVVSVAQWGRHTGVPPGGRFALAGDSISARVRRTGRPARMDYAQAKGVIADTVRAIGIRSSIGVPITVGGRTWGVMIVTSRATGRFHAQTESRLRDFTELLAVAISNASAHASIRSLAEEQAALSHVATLVARQTPEPAIFGAVAQKLGRLLDADSIEMVRYDDGPAAVVVAGWGGRAPPAPDGTRVPLEGENVTSLVFRTGRAARLVDRDPGDPTGERVTAGHTPSAVGTPIFVGGRLWGAMIAARTHGHPLPPDTEARIGQFTDLLATAIANNEARVELARLAHEQAALRRVATLVADGASPSAVFDAVTAEVSGLLDASSVSLARYDDDMLTVVATSGTRSAPPVGHRFPLGGTNVTSTVVRTGRTARLDDVAGATGPISDVARRAGVRAGVGTPVLVDGRMWGVLAAVWADRGPPPDDTEERMASFAGLLDTAIANADSREQLTASRARVLAAGDDARRRVVRDLHDGVQQRLVHTVVALKLARRALRDGGATAGAIVGEALGNAEEAMAELRELSHGILPSVLTSGGLGAAVDQLVTRSALPVDAAISSERLPRDIEASAYFILAEALTNVVKHARATRAQVTATVDDGILALEVRDDGIGGANPEGPGLMGIADRAGALGGEVTIDSAEQCGTVLAARLPLTT